MSVSFKELKKQRESAAESLAKKIKEMNESAGNKGADERFWYPDQDKAGNGSAVIRFLPAAPGEDVPWQRVYSHSFQGPSGQWLIEECPTTIKKPCPVCEKNSELWNSGRESDKTIVSGDAKAKKKGSKRAVAYISNIYVVSDENTPENGGKVFLFRFGKKLWDKINNKMNPEFKDIEPINVFDFWEGATFRLRFKKVDGYRNYDQSSFDEKSAFMGGDDEKLEELWNSQYSLNEFVDPALFKSEDELKAKVARVFGTGKTPQREVEVEREVEGDLDDVSDLKIEDDTDTESFEAFFETIKD